MDQSNNKSYVIRVSFDEPVDGKYDYYFGSVKAIFTRFRPKDIDASYWFLTCKSHVGRGETFSNSICTISKEEVIRLKQKKL